MNNAQRRERIKKLASKTTYIEFKPISNVYELRWPYPNNLLRRMTHRQVAVINASTGAVIEFSCATETGEPVAMPDNYLEKVDRRIRYLLSRLKNKVTS